MTIKKFTTERGIDVPAITTDQMREVDRIAIEETGPNLYQMMENAGRNLALMALDILGSDWPTANIVVLSGPGGNGGGGICAARHLANRQAIVRLCLADPDNLGEIPAYQRKIYSHTPGQEVDFENLREEPVDLILDALIGYSLKGAPRGPALDIIQWANQSGTRIVSLDVPSGIDSTSGETAGDYINANQTMTLALPKTGLVPEKTGTLVLADIGIPETVYNKIDIPYIAPFGNEFRIKLKT